jgi:hypothetical protein
MDNITRLQLEEPVTAQDLVGAWWAVAGSNRGSVAASDGRAHAKCIYSPSVPLLVPQFEAAGRNV